MSTLQPETKIVWCASLTWALARKCASSVDTLTVCLTFALSRHQFWPAPLTMPPSACGMWSLGTGKESCTHTYFCWRNLGKESCTCTYFCGRNFLTVQEYSIGPSLYILLGWITYLDKVEKEERFCSLFDCIFAQLCTLGFKNQLARPYFRCVLWWIAKTNLYLESLNWPSFVFRRAILKGHNRRVNACAADRGGKVLASAGWDCKVCIWNATSGEKICDFDLEW
jgi:WD40 repeat protein